MEWFPIIAGTFKVIVLCTGMFFAVKWHYDQGKKGKQEERRAVLRMVGKVTAIFVLLLTGLVFGTFFLAQKIGLDLNFTWW